MDLDFLYREAVALVIASEVEGFGLPIVEARQRGLRVVASDIPVFRELEDPHTLYFPLGDVDALIELLFKVGDSGKQDLQDEGARWMTWRESAQELLSRISEVLERAPSQIRQERKGAARMSRLLLRFRAWSHRSRVIQTSEGSVPADPYDPLYVLLTVQAKRLALAQLVEELHAARPARWPKVAVCVLIRYFDLRLATALANALIVERNLVRIDTTGRLLGADEARSRQA
jgi:hypothetical protein